MIFFVDKISVTKERTIEAIAVLGNVSVLSQMIACMKEAKQKGQKLHLKITCLAHNKNMLNCKEIEEILLK